MRVETWVLGRAGHGTTAFPRRLPCYCDSKSALDKQWPIRNGKVSELEIDEGIEQVRKSQMIPSPDRCPAQSDLFCKPLTSTVVLERCVESLKWNCDLIWVVGVLEEAAQLSR